jgi:perosamine synthetase
MDKFDDIVAERGRMAAYLNDRLRDLSTVETPEPPVDRERVYLYYNLRFEDEQTQAALADFLDERGIPSRVTYKPTHLNPYYREEWGWEQGDLSVTEEVSGRVLTLPFHMDLSNDDLDTIADAVRTFFE